MNRTHQPAPLAVVLVSVAVLAAAGCQDYEIRQYRVPKPEPEKPTRFLVAVLTPADATWFFKLSGPVESVAAHEDQFKKFLRTVRFQPKEEPPVLWTVPEEWKQGPKNDNRFATFFLGADDQRAELSVTRLGPEAGTLLDNVNRWRRQLALEPVAEADLVQCVKKLDLDAGNASLVDLTGTLVKGPKAAPFAAQGKQPAEADKLPFTYRKPEGWSATAEPRAMSLLSFAVADGKAEVTVVPLPGPAGGLLGNVNRWRSQVELDPVGEEQLKKDLKEIDVDGKACPYADVAGPHDRILGVLVARDNTTWFLKLRGDKDAVRKEKAAFEEFAKSVRFQPDKGGK